MSDRKRYALVGTGGRSRMFIDAIFKTFPEHAQLVGLCDISPTRMNYYNDHIRESFQAEPVPTFTADRFDEMVRTTKPDTVIVTSMDSTHHLYIKRAMELGCDVVTEKPMTIDAQKAQVIVDTVVSTGRRVRVSFNYRYQPAFTKLREIVASGVIGRPCLVDFQWRLDTAHGADYFRRWHREKACSGGLLVHKSTHHFDLVNFWLNDTPRTVFASGSTMFYGKPNADDRGESYAYDRYTGIPAAANDPFRLSLVDEDDHKKGNKANKSALTRLYKDAEADSGYIRDRNVFSDKWPLDAEDVMAVNVRYQQGTILSYSLVAFCPWEGERVAITGTKGQVEYFARGKGHVIAGQSDEDLAAEQYQGEKYIRVQQMFKPPVNVEIPKVTGGHGGGDAGVLRRIFLPEDQLEVDPFKRDADHLDGARSILTGIAANQSIATGQAIDVQSLIRWPEPALV